MSAPVGGSADQAVPGAVVLAMPAALPSRLFQGESAERLHALVGPDWGPPVTGFHSAEALERLARARVLLTGWGSPMIDDRVLDHAPHLRAVVHAAGTVKGHVCPSVFERGVLVSSAADANAVPVAEYTVAMILLANKAVPAMAREYRARREAIDLIGDYPDVGNHGKTVGLVGASKVGRRVAELLRPFDLEVLVSDPYLDEAGAAALGVRKTGLDDLFASCDVVSLHAPAIEETRGMVDAARLAAMRPGATLINTARGSLVDHDALIAELRRGRISAVLDVTEPEITPSDSPLWELPNVVLTPHVAGSLGNELARLGSQALDEVLRVIDGRPLRHPVDLAALPVTA
ncbi:hydroxyacid dehydrogenase [Planotetraspora phitsanulokensis]|uniref:2-hydroxyacid dehydrogenase n=1 Tax=Planotetraspora phitsanulokensis TaxID=575192 RepID=A0A8J3XJN0_9ACTN|nr:hydroxyacid dehydrogenase [Planotetraspora phitsanulokensis]GII42216.1 2-hydroxyacid dehydrogenase [Planotetraspora phitsanulokensis]